MRYFLCFLVVAFSGCNLGPNFGAKLGQSVGQGVQNVGDYQRQQSAINAAKRQTCYTDCSKLTGGCTTQCY